MRDPFSFLEELTSYGDVVQYRTVLGTFTALLHPDHVERVLLVEPDRFQQVDVADFDVGIDPDFEVDPGMTLRPADPVQVRIHER